MTEIPQEHISALFDGEIAENELAFLLARVDKDAQCRVSLARYGLIGEALRGHSFPAAAHLHEKVRSALGNSMGEVPNADTSARRWLVAAAVAGCSAVVIAALIGRSPWLLHSNPAVEAANMSESGLSNRNGFVNTQAAVAKLSPATSRMTSYLLSHNEYANPLIRSALDSNVITEQTESVVWRESQDPANAR